MRSLLVPKLLFGNALRRNSVSSPIAKRSFEHGVPKQEFGNEDDWTGAERPKSMGRHHEGVVTKRKTDFEPWIPVQGISME